LVRAFSGAANPDRSASSDAATELGMRLATVCAAVRSALPGLKVDDVGLCEALGRCAAMGQALEQSHPVDLALAAMASRGDGDAIAEIERHHSATIGFACHRFAGRDHSIDDLRQILRTQLFVASATSGPKIAEYSGRGTLSSWLRVTAARTFIDLIRRKDRSREALGSDELPEPCSPEDLALDAIKSEHRKIVAGALRDAFRELEAGTRHLLRQHLIVGVSIDQVGAGLGLHRSTAARRIAKAREELVRGTRRLVAARLKIPEREIDEVCGLVVSGIDVSMRALLATAPPESSGP
jgi:RNA polymerase sigma-70 factor, ECF subfamily